MYKLSLDPFTPDRPLQLAQMVVGFLHQTLDQRDHVQMDAVRPRLMALELEMHRTLSLVRYDAERLMYLAERAQIDGFPVHGQLIEVAEAHEVEIKRLGTEVISEYKALSRKIQLSQRAASVLKAGFELAETFQDGWLAIIRQMRHRAQAMARREVRLDSVVAAAAAYIEAAGGPEIELRPRIADDVIVYEISIPIIGPVPPAAEIADTLDRLHLAVEAAVPSLVGLLAFRIKPAEAADADLV
jgi:hypothetical protein